MISNHSHARRSRAAGTPRALKASDRRVRAMRLSTESPVWRGGAVDNGRSTWSGPKASSASGQQMPGLESRFARKQARLSCVIPCHNEADNLDVLLANLVRELEASGHPWEVILVDDGSTDHTAQQMSGWAKTPGFRILILARNFGKEAALTAGLETASGDVVVMLDADLQHPPALIHSFLQRWYDGADAVYARRVSREDESTIKRVGTRWFYRLMNAADRFEVPAGAGDFRLMDRKVVNALLALPERNRFMKGLYAWVGFDAVAVPYVPAARLRGQTQFSLLRLVRLSLDGLTGFTTWPLRAVSGVGMLMSALALIYGAFLAIEYMMVGHAISGWTTIVVGLMGVSGVQMLCLGILGEYIGRIFEEVKARPIYLVKQEMGQGFTKVGA